MTDPALPDLAAFDRDLARSLGQRGNPEDIDRKSRDYYESSAHVEVYGFIISMDQYTSRHDGSSQDVIERVDLDTLMGYERQMLGPADSETKRKVLPFWVRYIKSRLLAIRLFMAERTRHQQREGYRAFLRLRILETHPDVEVPPVPYAARPRPPSAPIAPPA